MCNNFVIPYDWCGIMVSIGGSGKFGYEHCAESCGACDGLENCESIMKIFYLFIFFLENKT